ncbi:carboxylesterase/lipase family protein [Nocardia seriolae]|uniref:Carboxylic ester hydrolase n=1 Tax=Nocardia seriolae TaxID=37332 RepID=A0A0B8NPZ0_9NOCA|nr:carboxylesterase family protein [Nocardia seriolae]MTJ61419.1 carboxylesterase family protein [Nocardia seriolae]MTJ75251.1 carboxylesterase family protein [Nocardia seriolae]MTK39389.1 carboxylesterase family protein [Nocardia seriolae]MTK47015.1 carboxylesterase family protein [Nocardia seriolae]MTL12038.1 carboxylesterase family protein [Nocardia seriolae]
MIVRGRKWAGRAGAVIAAVALLVMGFLVNGPVSRAESAAPDIVTIDSGGLHGVLAQDYRVFNGIPYAAPPVGELRWRPPQAVAPWPGIREARDTASNCPQTTGLGGLRSTDEDCLYLNVWTPRTLPADGRALPVMVWIHGGSLQVGSGSTYGAAPLVAQPDGDAIVVTINYRLGALGFLAASALDEGAGAGDYGLMDQQAALRWVQRNIPAFGGDPNRVTVAGESAGGISICAQMAVPAAAQLFRAAVLQSGPCTGQSLPDAEADGDAWAAGLGCAGPDSGACLRALPPDTLIDRAPDSASVVYGNAFLPESPVALLKAGRLLRIPTFIGSNYDEMALWVWMRYGNPLGPRLAPADYPAVLAAQLKLAPAVVDRITAEYPLSDYPQPAVALSRAWTDKVVCDLSTQIQDFSRRNPTYVYQFDDPSPLAPPTTFPMGAFHASELPSLFDLTQAGPLLHGIMTPDQQRLAAEMRRYWAHFVTTTSADPAPLQPIPQYSPNTPTYMSFRPSGNRLTDTFATDHRCAFWSGLPR